MTAASRGPWGQIVSPVVGGAHIEAILFETTNVVVRCPDLVRGNRRRSWDPMRVEIDSSCAPLPSNCNY